MLRSLKSRIALGTFAVQLALLGLVLWATVATALTSARDRIARQDELLVSLLADLGRIALLTEDHASFQGHLQRVVDESHATHAVLTDHQNRVVSSTDTGLLGNSADVLPVGEGRYWKTREIDNASGRLGSVSVQLSLAPLRQAHGRVKTVAVSVGLAGAVLAAVIALVLAHLVTQRLGRVSAAARRLADDDLDVHVGLSGSDEVARLGQAFDGMTARIRETLRSVRASERRWRDLVDNVDHLIFGIAGDGTVTFVNEAVCRALGRTTEQIVGHSICDHVRPDQDALCAQSIRQLHSVDRTPSLELVLLTADGSERICGGMFTAGLDADGQRVIRLMLRDLTEETQLRNQLFQAQKMEAVGQLAGGIAHDFNNLLTAIHGFCDLGLQKVEQGRLPVDELHGIEESAGRAAALTRQLLAFSRRQLLEPQVLDLNEVVDSALRMLERVIGETIELDARLSGVRCITLADRSQIEQILVNLAVNARDAMPGGGTLTIEVTRAQVAPRGGDLLEPVPPGDYVALAVRDSGQGIPVDIQPRLFEPFFTTKADSGTGLGLSTVYGIVKQSGGHIEVSSTPGHGAEFRLYFPRVEASEDALDRAAEPPPAMTPARLERTVLLVEDEQAVLSLLRQVLERAGCHVLQATNGEEAERVSNGYSSTIDLVLTDMVMPRMNGAELLTRLRRHRPEMRAVVMTGYAPDELAAELVAAADCEILQKPFSPSAMLDTLREVLAR